MSWLSIISMRRARHHGSQRSTLTFKVDLTNTASRFNLNYVTNLGVNWLWLEPIHPIGIVAASTVPIA
jgi:hypothetical protein